MIVLPSCSERRRKKTDTKTRRSESTVSAAPRRLWRPALLLFLLVCSCLSACSIGGGGDDKNLVLVTLFPTSGPAAAVGMALQQAVDLAAKQNGSLSNGYRLTVQHIDEASPLHEGSLL